MLSWLSCFFLRKIARVYLCKQSRWHRLEGGRSKTTVALHIASALTLFHDKRCLLIDSDPQANLTQALGFSSDSLKTLPKALNGIEATTELLSDPYSHERLSTGLSKIKKDFDYCIRPFVTLPGRHEVVWLPVSQVRRDREPNETW